MKLIMLPYAGSIFNAYREWEPFTSSKLEIISIDYCGRGKNAYLEEPASWEELVATTCNLIKQHINTDEEYILFGHSMGAKVAYSVYGQLKSTKDKLPVKLVFSGTKSFDTDNKDLYSLSVKEFQDYFIKMGRIKEDVLQNIELREMIFEYLRKDMNLLKGFNFVKERVDIKCPVIIINGNNDEKSSEERWLHVLGKPCVYFNFEGNHFFLFQNKTDVYCRLSKELMKC